MFKLKGLVIVASQTTQLTEKFSKRDLVIQTDDMYPQLVSFQLSNDKCALLDGIKDGDTVYVSFNVRGREWVSPTGEKKYFNTLDAWKVDRLNAVSTPAVNAPTQSNPTSNNTEDDLPF